MAALPANYQGVCLKSVSKNEPDHWVTVVLVSHVQLLRHVLLPPSCRTRAYETVSRPRSTATDKNEHAPPYARWIASNLGELSTKAVESLFPSLSLARSTPHAA